MLPTDSLRKFNFNSTLALLSQKAAVRVLHILPHYPITLLELQLEHDHPAALDQGD